MSMGSARFFVILLSVVIITTLPSHATQYVNRILEQCQPLAYRIEPLEIYGGGLRLDRNYHNAYGDCTMEPPGPPFVIELPVIIDNIYNADGSVAQGCSFVVDNSFGGGDPFEIWIQDEGYLLVNGDILADGKAGDMIIFKNSGGMFNTFSGGPVQISPYEYTWEFTWCNFQANASLGRPTVDMRGGHVSMNNCSFGGTADQHCLYYTAIRNDVWDFTINNCAFGGVSHPTRSPVWLVGIRSLDLNNAVFNGCDYPVASPSSGVLEIGGNFILKNLNGISGGGNSRNWVYLNASTVYIEDSCTIKTSNDFTAFIADYILVDSNATLMCEKGTVLQMNNEPESKIIVRGKMVIDSTVITSFADRSHGVTVAGWSTDDPDQGLSWRGIDVEVGGDLEINNNSLIRWADGPIVSDGNVTVDHSTIEQGWGTAINMHYTSPCSLMVRGSRIKQAYGLGEGIDFTMSIDNSDSASGYLVVDSTRITQCGGDGIYLGGGVGRALEDNLSVRITNSVISGNGGSGIYGFMGQPADSIVILNNQFVGNGAHGMWLDDNGCDSMCVRLENNVALGNNGAGLGVKTGFADVIGNTSAYNEGYGLYYPYKPRRLGHVANNIFAYNDSYGLYCYAKYGGIVPGISHNLFWQNRDADNELYVNSDEFLITTLPELQALGGVGTTNAEISPAFKPVYKDRILVRYYDEALVQSRMWVDGDELSPGALEGLAILPSHNDTASWYYVIRNTVDSIFVAGDIRPTSNPYDTLTVYNFHLTSQSGAIDFGDSSYVSTEFDIDGDQRILDSDENGTELVDAGADEFNPDSTNLQILVFSPTADTTLVPGENIVLSWFAPAVALVNIDYTTDIPLGEEPTEWLEVAHNLPASAPAYNWEVPNAMSSRCMIRISDVSSPGFNGTSDIFHIKQPRLTRFAADSTYEFFVPSIHGWSIPNEVNSMWPQTLWQEIDYLSGIDPYTGQEYPSYDTAYPFGAKNADCFPSWPLWVETFKLDQCYYNTPEGATYVMRALYRWDANAFPWYGSCVGLSTTSLLAFGSADLLAPRWGHLGLPDDINQVTLSADVREFINVHQSAAYGREQWEYFARGFSIPIDTTLAAIRRQLLKTDRDDAAIVIGSQQQRGSHAMTPYAIVPDVSPGSVQVLVYDPDRPSIDNNHVLVDTVNDTWTYDGYPNWGGSNNFFLYFPVRSLIDWPDLSPKPAESSVARQLAEDAPLFELFYTSTAELALYEEGGDSMGYNESGVFNTVGEGGALVPMDIDSNRPIGFCLPDRVFRGTLSSTTAGSIQVGCFYDSLYVGYERRSGDSGETDQFTLSNGMTLSNPDLTSKPVQMRVIATLPDRERSFVATGLTVAFEDTVMVEPLSDTGWYLSNRGNATQYDLWFREVSTGGEAKFYSKSVPIGDQQSHIIVPDWSADNRDSCVIYIDNDGDFAADDWIVVYADILVGVEDDPSGILPYRFELAQNYPNPFNPVTTIEYGLPRRSHVTIEVFNVLGQRVRSLVNREESAGSYTITWDGKDQSGKPVATGVYLYRFQAGDHVETKKMLLLK